MDPEEVKRIIEQGLPGSRVLIEGDGRHFEAVVISESFAGRSLLEQHRMVYRTLGERFQTDSVHALSFRTYTPAEWEGRQ